MSIILTEKPPVKEIPRNQPAPLVNPRIQETLTRIGGRVPASGGPFAGMPIYRLAWGQEETHFSRGKRRLRFLDEDIEPVVVQERFFVSPDVFHRAAKWQHEREQNRFERVLNCDFTVFAETEPLSSYLKQFESNLNYQQLADAAGSREEVSTDVLGIASSSAPKDWIYLCDVKEIIEIGKPLWYVMRWIPASSHGGRKAWNDMRYSLDAYVPELNRVVPMIDDLGPFTEYGFYIPRLEIAEYEKDADGELNHQLFKTTEPTEANCIEPVIEMLYERAKLTNQDKNIEFRAAQKNDQLIERRDKNIAAQEEKNRELLGIHNEPVMNGKIHKFQS